VKAFNLESHHDDEEDPEYQEVELGRVREFGRDALHPVTEPDQERLVDVDQGDGTDDVVTRLTAANLPVVVKNKQLELHVYGKDGYLVRTAQHQGRNDLWSGMATTPIAVTLRDKGNYLDLTGLARVRWIVRTNSVSALHPIVKLADGTYIVARRAIETNGEFLSVELSFNDLKWFKLDPEKVVPSVEVKNPDLTKVDEFGMAFLAPGGGHGTASSINLSDVEVYAKPVPR